jgi:hypothetical protein
MLAVALLASLFFAGRHVYRALPSTLAGHTDGSGESELTIVMRDAASAPPAETRVEIYPIDFAATERDFLTNSRPGRSLEDFLAQRLKTLIPVRVKMDQNGHAVAALSFGKWWMRATSARNNGEEIEWREQLTISQRALTIELAPENAYERRKKF